MHQWNIWYGKPMGNHTVFPCYTSMAKIALWQMFSRQLQQEVGCILCSLSKVEELGFFSFENSNRTVSLEFWDKEISHNCKFCFECLSVVSMCLFFFPPAWILQPSSFFERYGFLTDLLAGRAAFPTMFSSLPFLFVVYSICPNPNPPQILFYWLWLQLMFPPIPSNTCLGPR